MHHRFDVVERPVRNPCPQILEAIVHVAAQIVWWSPMDAGLEAVEAHDVGARVAQRVHDVRADESGAAGHQDFHARAAIVAAIAAWCSRNQSTVRSTPSQSPMV